MFQNSITSRQKKFCEGFLFFPIRQLKKYGGFIYKQYSKQARIRPLLDMKIPSLDFHMSYATVLHSCIEDQAMPQAAKILSRMEGFYSLIQQNPNDVSDLIVHYYQELTVCNNVVLRNLKDELAPLLKQQKEDADYITQQYDHIMKVHRLLKECVSQTRNMVNILDDYLSQVPNAIGNEQLGALLEEVKHLYSTQQRVCLLLRNWEEAKMLHTLQTYYN